MAKKQIVNEDEGKVNETAASDSLTTHNPVSRSDLMASAMDHFSKGDTETLTKWWTDALASYTNLGRGVPDGTAEKNKSGLNMKPSFASSSQPAVPAIQAVKEDLEVLIKDQNLPEEFVNQAVILFESAVNARVALEAAKIQEAADADHEEQLQVLVEKIDGYLDYAAEEFFKENELAIESSLRLQMQEQFLEELHDLFDRHYITVPEGKVEVLEALGERIEELEGALNVRTQELLELQDVLDAELASTVFEEAAKGLDAKDTEKLKTLAETVEFDGNPEALLEKLNIIREAHFSPGKTKPAPRQLDMTTGDKVVTLVEADVDQKDLKALVEAAGPDMGAYVATMSRLAGYRK
jgi:hypothetical protein